MIFFFFLLSLASDFDAGSFGPCSIRLTERKVGLPKNKAVGINLKAGQKAHRSQTITACQRCSYLCLSRIRRCCRKGLFPKAMWQVDPCCDEQASGTDAALLHGTGPESVITCLGAWFYC